MRIILPTLIIFISLLGTAFGQCSDADKSALEAFDHAWSKAIQGGDRAALEKMLADDYMAIPGMGTKQLDINGWVANYERNKANPQGGEPVVSDRYIINCSRNGATITHRNIFTSNDGPGGRETTTWFRSIHVLEKRGGNWQVVSNMGHQMDDQMSLQYLEQDWNDANKVRDISWFEKNFAPDYVSVGSTTGTIFNKAEDIESTKNDKSTIELTETTGVNVRIDRNTAVVTGTYRWKGKDEKGVAFDNKIRYIDTWIKRDGRWQVLATIGTPIK